MFNINNCSFWHICTGIFKAILLISSLIKSSHSYSPNSSTSSFLLQNSASFLSETRYRCTEHHSNLYMRPLIYLVSGIQFCNLEKISWEAEEGIMLRQNSVYISKFPPQSWKWIFKEKLKTWKHLILLNHLRNSRLFWLKICQELQCFSADMKISE